jgi:hypothetical protein
MSSRRGPARRTTPDLIAFHKINAKRLRLEARRNAWRVVFAWLSRIFARR